MSRNYLSKYDQLRKGDFLMSNNREYKAIFQHDGNFVIHGWGKVVWASDTNGSDADRLCMQEDCNLVLYNEANVAKWAIDSYAPGNNWTHCTLTDDGKLVITKDSNVLWTSDHNRGTKKPA